MTGMNWAAATMPSQIGSCGQLEDEPGLGDLLHPGPDQRDRLAGEEQPVVAVAEGAHAVRRGQPARPNGSRPITVGPRCGVARRRRRVVGMRAGPPSSSARWASRWRRRARASSIIVASRAALASRVSIWRSTRWRASTRSARRSAGSSVVRKRSRLRSRAASSSSSWPIWARREAGVVAQAADERAGARGRRRRTGGSRRPTGRPARAGRSPRSSGSRGSSGRFRRRLR